MVHVDGFGQIVRNPKLLRDMIETQFRDKSNTGIGASRGFIICSARNSRPFIPGSHEIEHDELGRCGFASRKASASVPSQVACTRKLTDSTPLRASLGDPGCLQRRELYAGGTLESGLSLESDSGAGEPMGSRNQKVLPSFDLLSTPTLPPWASMISRTIINPRPVPDTLPYSGARA